MWEGTVTRGVGKDASRALFGVMSNNFDEVQIISWTFHFLRARIHAKPRLFPHEGFFPLIKPND